MGEERIRDYLIERLIGAGGMGMVYLAKHENLHRHAAIKVLLENLSTSPQIRERFIQEARLMGSLDHPNIVTLYDFTTEPKLSLIMEFVDGRGLDEMIGQDVGPIPWEKALPLFIQILDGIGYAHSKGIVHRDIKPANIIISKEGQVKVTDLGIAKIAGQQGMTRTGAQMGTLYYESPEQIKGAKDVDHRSDIYSLGMTLYEMLAGRLPFDKGGDTSEFELMIGVVQRKGSLDPREFYPHIPEWLVKTIQKATELNPEKRFQSCEHFKQIIEKYGKLLATESTFWSGKVASAKRVPISKSKPFLIGSTKSTFSLEGQCPQCHVPVKEEMEFCMKCGSSLQKKCLNCSSFIRWHADFCPKCGVNEKEMRINQKVELERELIEKKQGREKLDAVENKRLKQIRLIKQGDQRFSKKNNIITDNITSLEWQIGSDEDVNWNNARKWITNLDGNWRMPSLAELQELHKAGIEYGNWGLFFNRGYRIWSDRVEGSSSAWYFDFRYGNQYHYTRSSDYDGRKWAVRSR